MAIKRRTWIILLIAIVLMLLYFIFVLYLGTLTDMKYGAMDRLIMSDHSGISKEVENTVYNYVNSFSIFILIQFVLIFYLIFKIRKQ